MLCCAGGLGMTVMLEPLEEVPEGAVGSIVQLEPLQEAPEGAVGGIVQLEPLEEGSGGAVVGIEERSAQILEPSEGEGDSHLKDSSSVYLVTTVRHGCPSSS